MTTEAHARGTDPHTSHDAAADVRLTNLEDFVLYIIQNGPITGMTKDDVHAAQNRYERDSLSPRFKPLWRKGKIVEVGTRKVKSGKNQTVWIDTDRAMSFQAWCENNPS